MRWGDARCKRESNLKRGLRDRKDGPRSTRQTVIVLIEGTTWLEAFGGDPCCLIGTDDLRRAFDGWTLPHDRKQAFDAPGGTVKRFATVIARRPKAL